MLRMRLDFAGDHAEPEVAEWESQLQSASGPEAEGIRSVSRPRAETPEGTLGDISLEVIDLVIKGLALVVPAVTLIYTIWKDRRPTNTITVVVEDGQARIAKMELSGSKSPEQTVADMQAFIDTINRYEQPDNPASRA